MTAAEELVPVGVRHKSNETLEAPEHPIAPGLPASRSVPPPAGAVGLLLPSGQRLGTGPRVLPQRPQRRMTGLGHQERRRRPVLRVMRQSRVGELMQRRRSRRGARHCIPSWPTPSKQALLAPTLLPSDGGKASEPAGQPSADQRKSSLTPCRHC